MITEKSISVTFFIIITRTGLGHWKNETKAKKKKEKKKERNDNGTNNNNKDLFTTGMR